MSKIEITLPLSGYAGKKELSFHFQKIEEDFGYNADLTVWVPLTDSVPEMQRLGVQQARIFLAQMLSALDAEYPPKSEP